MINKYIICLVVVVVEKTYVEKSVFSYCRNDFLSTGNFG